MPSHPRRHDEPGHTHLWTISCYRRLQVFRDDGMERVVVDALRTLPTMPGVCLVGFVVMPEHDHVLLYRRARANDDGVVTVRPRRYDRCITVAAFCKHEAESEWIVGDATRGLRTQALVGSPGPRVSQRIGRIDRVWHAQ